MSRYQLRKTSGRCLKIQMKKHHFLLDSLETLKKIIELRHDKTNKLSVHPVKTQTSLGIRPVWSVSSMCAYWVAKDPSFLHADSKDSAHTGQMPRLIWGFAGRTLILLVLSCRGSFVIVNRENVLLALTSPENSDGWSLLQSFQKHFSQLMRLRYFLSSINSFL